MILILSVLVLNGCATKLKIEKADFENVFIDIVATNSELKSKDFFKKTIHDKLQDIILDKPSEKVFEEIFKKHTNGYNDEMIVTTVNATSNEELLVKFLEMFTNKLRLSSNDIHKVDKLTCDNNATYGANFEIVKQDMNSGLLKLIINFNRKCMFYNSVLNKELYTIPKSKVILSFKYNYLPTNVVHVEMTNIETENTNLPFAKNQIDKNKIVSIFNNCENSINGDPGVKFNNIEHYVICEMQNRLRNRFKITPDKIVKLEHLYSNDIDISLSRIQRAFNDYKYDRENTRFDFEKKISLPYKKFNGLKYNNFPVYIDFVLRLYPESKSKTMIVYECKIEEIYDTFDESIIFGINDGTKMLHELKNEISKKMGN